MSLLNQVLQDLEKRNAKNLPEQQLPANVKAITTNQSRSYYFAFALFCIIGIIAIIIFNAQKTPETLEKSDAAKQNVALQTSNDIIIKTLKKPSVPKAVRSKHTATNTIQNDKQLIKSDKSAKQKIVEKNTKDQTVKKISGEQKAVKKKPKNQTVKKLSDEQKAEHYFSLAEKQRNNSDKQKNLEQAIQLNPQHINARMLLTNTFLQQGLTIQSAELLDQSLNLFPQNLQFIRLRSQLYLQQKQAQNALSVLHHIDENHVQDETYLSLLAAAYQQTDDNFNSLKSYQKLIKINPQKAEYWLGMAIALEKQDHPQQALDAYQQALNKNTLKSVIVSYIKERISILK